MKNYYAILEVPVGCGVPEVREAYRRLVQEHLWNRDTFAQLKEAYEVLSTPARRADYDRMQFGQTFADAPPTPAQTDEPPRFCPMGAASQCPVVGARVAPTETYCPECGILLSAMPDPAAFPDFAAAQATARLETPDGQVFALHPGANVVGREDADVLLPDKTVSRRHAQIVLAADGQSATVEDFASTNGTRTGGDDALSPDTPIPLQNNTRLVFGSVELVLLLPEAAARPASARARLTVARGPDTSIAHLLAAGVTTFGRRAENTVVLSGDPYISGQHAQIEGDDDSFRVSDLGSTNGTRVNSELLSPHQPQTLQEGDEVIFGGTVYRFEHLAPAETTDAP